MVYRSARTGAVDIAVSVSYQCFCTGYRSPGTSRSPCESGFACPWNLGGSFELFNATIADGSTVAIGPAADLAQSYAATPDPMEAIEWRITQGAWNTSTGETVRVSLRLPLRVAVSSVCWTQRSQQCVLPFEHLGGVYDECMFSMEEPGGFVCPVAVTPGGDYDGGFERCGRCGALVLTPEEPPQEVDPDDDRLSPDEMSLWRVVGGFGIIMLGCCVGAVSFFFVTNRRRGQAADAADDMAAAQRERVLPGEGSMSFRAHVHAGAGDAEALVDSVVMHVKKLKADDLDSTQVCCVCLESPTPDDMQPPSNNQSLPYGGDTEADDNGEPESVSAAVTTPGTKAEASTPLAEPSAVPVAPEAKSAASTPLAAPSAAPASTPAAEPSAHEAKATASTPVAEPSAAPVVSEAKSAASTPRAGPSAVSAGGGEAVGRAYPGDAAPGAPGLAADASSGAAAALVVVGGVCAGSATSGSGSHSSSSSSSSTSTYTTSAGTAAAPPEPEADSWVQLPCRHALHLDCLRLWLLQRTSKLQQMICPVCRARVADMLAQGGADISDRVLQVSDTREGMA
ncbi:hypothetical protein DIPPA_32398 [Diplonema papillatum]|nr:hypothetical protein DIPPA_32398 [Diplonema papillatum]